LTEGSLLSVEGLVTEFDTDEGTVRAVDNVNFSVEPGKTVGVVGESGCGKSVTALSIMRLLPQPMGRIAAGSIRFDGRELTALSLEDMQRVRGNDIGMVFQEPMTALNPVHTIGRQLTEGLRLHRGLDTGKAAAAAVEILDRVGIPSPDVRLGEYPHQLSGGMRQRVVIAIALACRPALLIADEPTTALDVTIQAQILELIGDLQKEMGMSVILITHDLGVIAETCDDVVVMYAGKVAERGSVYDIFDRPAHPYTRGLLQSIPTLESKPKSTLHVIEGMVPGLRDLPQGCRFENRCPHSKAHCTEAPPGEESVAEGHHVSCYEWRGL
jgi:peptide/nickel transport system ATP-binding protein